jgi:DNA repair photolyase
VAPPSTPPLARLREVTAKSILRRSKYTDSWFVARYGMNLYRGCEHACAYCDGRAEKYNVEGEFGRDIEVKVNALELLEKEVARIRERSFVFVGGGVSDAYQPAERTYGLARGALEILAHHGRPVHVLTKSALVERDLDLLAELARGPGAIVSFSFCSLDPADADLFEPGCAPVEERLRVLRAARARGVSTGAMLMPIIPNVTDGEAALSGLVSAVARAGVEFVLPGGMTLKPGRQTAHFFHVLGGRYPAALVESIRALYGWSRWGAPRGSYHSALERTFSSILREHRVPSRIPQRLYRGRVEPNVEVAMVLSHLHHFLEASGERPPVGLERAAIAIQGLREDVAAISEAGLLGQVPGVGPEARAIVEEIVSTGRCAAYERLLGGGEAEA